MRPLWVDASGCLVASDEAAAVAAPEFSGRSKSGITDLGMYRKGA
jgi:hypothetical protein